MNKTILIIVAILIVFLGGYFLLKGRYQAPVSAPTPTVAPKETETTQTPITGGVTEISVAGTEFSFSPANISVKAGKRVKITFSNNGRTPHNLTLEGLGIATKTIGGSQTDVVEFTAPSSGTYTFFCSVPGHRASGMKGVLKVE